MPELPAVGDERTSQGRTVTEADLAIWGGLVHDFTPLHFDAHLMSESFFGRPIAHGYIAMNLSVGLFFPVHRAWLSPGTTTRSAGWEGVRFHHPVQTGDPLPCRRTITALDGDLVSHRVEMLNQTDEVVMSGIEHLELGQVE